MLIIFGGFGAFGCFAYFPGLV